MRASKLILFTSSFFFVQCSWYKDYVAKKDLNLVCTKAQAFLWDDYKSKTAAETKTAFEAYMFQEIHSRLVKRIWDESFIQPLDLRYSYFSSQLKGFGADDGACLILENLFEEKIPEQAFPIQKAKE